MKLNYFLLLTTLLISVFFMSSCVKPSAEPRCLDCPSPEHWSACAEEAAKTRTNYRCDVKTNYSCESYTEEKACETEIKMKGAGGILKAAVSPTLDENVKGIIKVEVLAVPEGTEIVKFIFAPQEVQIGPRMDTTKVIIEIDTNSADGWKTFFDTTKVGDGLYKIVVGSTYEGAPDENPWLDYALTQVIVKN